MALVKQIYSLINDSVSDALGKNASIKTLETTDIVSLGKAIGDYDAYDKFFGALANRIVKTVYFVRVYNQKSRSVLMDESEYGAFVQKVYTAMPDAVENPSHEVTTIDPSTGARTYSQESPYDVEATISVSAIVFAGQGTWSHEFIYSLEEIKTAFTGESEMMRLIDAIYTTADNRLKLDLERLEADAVNTSIANCIKNSKCVDLLDVYNDAHTGHELTREEALEDLDFLKFAVKEIRETISHIQNMNVNFNVKGYETFTPKENLVVEVLSHFNANVEAYLQADTFHKDLVSLPRFNEVAYWQTSGKTFAFDDCSAIKVKNTAIDASNPIAQDGIVCFIRDTENVAAYFGYRKTWEVYNPRSEVMIHGEKARKGYAVDDHANAWVFYIGEYTPSNKKAKAEVK